MSPPDCAKVLPPETALSRPFWEACRKNELHLQRCDQCDRFQFYPRTLCSHCENDSLSWCRVSGRGRVASFTIVRHGISEAYEVPYVVALIDLNEGPRIMTNVVDCDPETVAIDDLVEVQFEAWSSDYTLPVFIKTK